MQQALVFAVLVLFVLIARWFTNFWIKAEAEDIENTKNMQHRTSKAMKDRTMKHYFDP